MRRAVVRSRVYRNVARETLSQNRWRVMSLEVFWRRGGALSDRALNNTLCVYRLSRGNAGNAAVVSAHLEDVMAASRDHDCSRFSCPAA